MDTIDDIGRRAAATLHADAAAIADAELDTLLDALAASATTTERPARRWAVLGAAAAVAVAVAGGVVVVANREPVRPDQVPATTGPPNPLTTPPPTTPSTPPASSVVPSTTAPAATTTVPPPPTGDGLAVSYKNPPPFLEPQVFGNVEAADDGSLEDVQVMETGVVVVEGATARVVAWDGTTREVDVSAAIENDLGGLTGWAAGPGDMLYAITVSNTNDASLVAVPLSGDRQGEAVAATPISLVVIPERPYGSIGHGATGLVDRVGRIDGVVAPYVDENGDPWPEPLTIREFRKDGDVVSSLDGSQAWPLTIERADTGNGLNGPAAPSPAPGGGAVWWDWIGPRGDNGDYSAGTMEVIAFLAPDGSATWRRVPDGWGVVGADVWGTVLARRNGTGLDLALATTTTASTPAEQVVTDYLTALAARDYATAAALLGNDGPSLSDRPDLAPIRQLLAGGATLEDALRDWCEGDDGRAACWMPSHIGGGGPTSPGAPGPAGAVVVANYDDRDVGPQARYVVGEWEGQPSVYGLPPLVELRDLRRLRDLLGVDVLWTAHPEDAAVATVGPTVVVGPPESVGASVSPDGRTLWWAMSDGGTTVTDTAGTIVCTVGERVIELLGEPGAYRAIVERWGEAGPQDDPLATPTFEIDCATGAESPAAPRSWNGGPVTRRVRTAGERRFTSTGTDHHVAIVNDAGLELGTADRIITEPYFSPDGSIVVYGDNTGSANPSEVTRYVARNTTTDALLWTYDPATTVTGVKLTSDRAIFTGSIDDALPALGTTSFTALDLATGAMVMEVPATFTLLHVE